MDAPPVPRWQLVLGWVLTALPSLLLVWSGVNLILMVPMVKEGMERNGFPESTGPAVGVCALVSGLLTLFTRTAVLGAVLVTGYLGGAVATHVRVGDGMWLPPVVVGVLVWLGLVLRDRRLRAVLPWRS